MFDIQKGEALGGTDIQSVATGPSGDKKIAMIGAAILILIIAGAFLFLFIREKNTSAPIVEVKPTSTPPVIKGLLPSGWPFDNTVSSTSTPVITDLKAENIFFGNFYKKIELPPVTASRFNLPINSKTDISNYYEISRKIDLDPALPSLNNNGFAIINNPFPDQANDFFKTYALLDSKNIPVAITSDFLIYYYQNILKSVYKEVEAGTFYDELWNINKSFFAIADARYKKTRGQMGIKNDPVLEGERLEAAYFAVALELLKPKPEQINNLPIAGETEDGTKFNQEKAKDYTFFMPDYLTDDATREVKLIMAGVGEAKSPLFLYFNSYTKYQIPQEYKTNVRLSNFFLGEKWLSSDFPLYYRGAFCPECLLDKSDIKINLAAATFIARDFTDNQELKNRWAKIYKAMSFFSGLRKDLTYLHYDGAMSDLFGSDYRPEEIFSSDNKDQDDNFSKLQKKVAEIKFNQLEGGYDREDLALRPALGMRMLSESYWPDDYIFNQLTYSTTASSSASSSLSFAYLKDNKNVMDSKNNNNTTACFTNFKRCVGIGKDIINLIHPIPPDDLYFKENSNYEDYAAQVDKLKEQLKEFDVNSWHNNNYWTTLNIAKTIFESDVAKQPTFASTSAWQEKNLNTALGAWANLRLPMDEWTNGFKVAASLETGETDYSYVEPNLDLMAELSADAKMLKDTLLNIEIISENDFAYKDLSDLILDLTAVSRISVKELKGQDLTVDDLGNIKKIYSQFAVQSEGVKKFSLNFKSGQSINENLGGVKLLILTRDVGEKQIFVVGPVFNYSEGGR
jgi:hypothetical protein